MKNLSFLTVFILLLGACVSKERIINIPANDQVTLTHPELEDFAAELHNRSLRDVEVAVLDPNGKQVSGFGLNGGGKATITVQKNNTLTLNNSGTTTQRVQVAIRPTARQTFEREGEYVTFTLANASLKSIPLIIPSVMNPNLSPQSKSGVSLAVGQEIFFKKNGKRYLLLKVDDSIQNGDVIEVTALLSERKKELGL